MSHIECHERDPKTNRDLMQYTYCGFALTGSPICLGKGQEVTCPHCIKIREATVQDRREPND